MRGFTLAEAVEPRHHNGFWSKGFTLAEVLITLGIIGVVAALTIPTLVQNYQTRAWNTAATVFERKLEEALKTMNVQQTLAGYRDTESFVNELSKHFKITKICKNDELTSCFSDKVYWGIDNEEIDVANLKTASKFGQKNWDTNVIGAQFANGTTGLIAYNPDCKQDPYSNKITGKSCLAILYDTSGHKNPNTQNKDLRSINVASLNGKNCAFELDGVCFTAPFKADEPLTKKECEEIADQGFGNKKEYCKETDYWAGAVKQCGGTDKMPTMEHLAKIANYVYNTSNIGAMDNVENLKLDNDKVAELGFTLDAGGRLFIWAGEEDVDYGARHRNFFDTSTSKYYWDLRTYNTLYAVCLAD